MAAVDATAGGPAAGVRWDLSHLYAGPEDPRIEKDLVSRPSVAGASTVPPAAAVLPTDALQVQS